MRLSIIIAVYNERKLLPSVLEKIYNLNLKIGKEVIVIDDCSTDGTWEWIKENLVHRKDIKIGHHDRNWGKTRAIRTGLDMATGNIVVIQDADLEYDPAELSSLLEPILEGKAKVVYGSRNLLKHKSYSLLYYLGNAFLTQLTNILYKTKITDLETCYKMFKRELMKDIKLCSSGFGFEPEFTVKVLKRGHKIYEVPIRYSARDRKEGKKLTWLDGIRTMWILVKYRFYEQV